jgi:hypothetical protein
MTNKLTLVEAEALNRLATKLVAAAKKDGKTSPGLEAGNYTYDFTVKCDGSMSRGAATKVLPSFKIENLLKAVILLYASSLDAEDGLGWLEAVMAADGVAGAVVQLGPEAALSRVDVRFTTAFDAASAALKHKHQNTATKVDRAGTTVVVGAVERVANCDLAER